MMSSTGEYKTTIRKRKDGGYNIHLFAVHPDGFHMDIGGHDGCTSLDEARRVAREWMADCEAQDRANDAA